MRILAIETSTMLGGAAILDSEGGLLCEVRVNVRAAHSERLMGAIDYALGQAALTMGDIDALAVSAGPGSFTGLRIGLSTAKGLAFATGLPIAAVPTLEAFAWAMPLSGRPLCPMLDARKKEVYAGVFRHEGGVMQRVMPEAAVSPRALAQGLAALGEDVVLAGQGAQMYRPVFAEALGGRMIMAPPHLMVPSPAALAWVGLGMALEGRFSDPMALSPLYLRKSEAELKAG